MVVYRILPALTSEFVNPDMVPFVLPNVLLIAEECTKDEYIRLILPDLTPVFKQQEPIQVDDMDLQDAGLKLLLNHLVSFQLCGHVLRSSLVIKSRV